MIWRSVIIAGYVALAIVVGIAYGGRGLVVLSYFYFWAGAWVAFLVVWGGAARAAGRWNVRRLETPRLPGDRDDPRPGGGDVEPVEQHEVGVDADPLAARHTKRPAPVPVL